MSSSVPSKIPQIYVDYSKCTGCGICEATCAGRREGRFGRVVSRIRCIRAEPALDLPIVCLQCFDAPCINVCKSHAKYRNEKGIVVVDESKCTGCGDCVNTCSTRAIGAVWVNPLKKVAIKCDLCGGDPKCISACPWQALSLKELDHEELRRVRERLKAVLFGMKHNLLNARPGGFAETVTSHH